MDRMKKTMYAHNLTGHLIGCGKKRNIMQKFLAILCRRSGDSVEKMPDYWKFLN